jgi:3-hydroxyisobutyrate dehydrogenase-like beta-hydroxyacid dehydrogenase
MKEKPINLEATTVASGGIQDCRAICIGVIGLGMIGGGIAQCYARHGRALSVYDIRPDASDKLLDVPPVLASPAAVTQQSDVVIVAVVDANQVRAVLNGPNGILSVARPGLVVLIVSTIAVSVIRELADLVAPHGVHLIDAGVTGGDKAAAGGLVVLTGGDETVVDAISPVLAEFSPLVLYMGPQGSGMAAKIARNVITYSVWHTVYEAGLLAEKAGVDLRKLVEAVRGSDPQGHYATLFLQQRGTVAPLPADDARAQGQAAFVAQLMRKDLEAALSLADELGIRLDAVPVALAGTEKMLGMKALS